MRIGLLIRCLGYGRDNDPAMNAHPTKNELNNMRGMSSVPEARTVHD